ncbi:hypothetical protein Hdeb2414_s0106g00796061 [Helianthus debilis subsp. tardiflorus]
MEHSIRITSLMMVRRSSDLGWNRVNKYGYRGKKLSYNGEKKTKSWKFLQ